MKRLVFAAFIILFAPVVAAFAADLTDSDYSYIRNHWGLKQDSPVVRNLTNDERARLHRLIDDPSYRGDPRAIEDQVGDYLFEIETCIAWSESHRRGEPCPNAPSPQDPPGKRIADGRCASCHLVGSADAPSFYQLARAGGWTAQRLGAALSGGHQMSPIILSDAELRDLAAYIASLK